MSEVAVGDKIAALDAAGRLVYSEVLLFLDRNTAETRNFVQIRTASGQLLSITDSHLVQVIKEDRKEECSTLDATADCYETIFAGNVQVGYSVLVQRRDGDDDRHFYHDRVIEVSAKQMHGVYAPLTADGTLVVDNVVASAYAVIDSQSIAHAAFGPVRWARYWADNVKYLWSAVTKMSPHSDTKHNNNPLSSVITSNNIDDNHHNSQLELRESGKEDGGSTSFLPHHSLDNNNVDTTLIRGGSDGIHWYADLLYSVAGYILPGHLVHR